MDFPSEFQSTVIILSFLNVRKQSLGVGPTRAFGRDLFFATSKTCVSSMGIYKEERCCSILEKEKASEEFEYTSGERSEEMQFHIGDNNKK